MSQYIKLSDNVELAINSSASVKPGLYVFDVTAVGVLTVDGVAHTQLGLGEHFFRVGSTVTRNRGFGTVNEDSSFTETVTINGTFESDGSFVGSYILIDTLK